MAVVYLELQNVSDRATPKEICIDQNLPHQFVWRLQDEKGVHQPESATAASIFISTQPCWLTLPFDSTVRFRVSVSGYGIKPDGGIAFQLLGSFWQVPRKKEGAYYLSATFSSPPDKPEGRHAWIGQLKLPKVRVPERQK